LKVNENPGFVSFGGSVCPNGRDLTGSTKDEAGVDCSRVNCFGPSVELAVPNPANGVPGESPKENIDDPFFSESVGAGWGSIAEAMGGVGTFPDSGIGLQEGKPPNMLGDWVVGGGGGEGNELFRGSTTNGDGSGASTLASGVGEIDTVEEETAAAIMTGSVCDDIGSAFPDRSGVRVESVDSGGTSV
jgi:hypothetical protein